MFIRNTKSQLFLLAIIVAISVASSASGYEVKYIEHATIGIWDDSGRALGFAIETEGQLAFYTKDRQHIGYKTPIRGPGAVFDSDDNFIADVHDNIMGAIEVLYGPDRGRRQRAPEGVSEKGVSVIMFEGHSVATLLFSLNGGRFHRVADENFSSVYAFVIPSGISKLQLRYGGRAPFGTWEVDFDSNTFYHLVNISGGQLKLRRDSEFRSIGDLGFNERVRLIRIP